MKIMEKVEMLYKAAEEREADKNIWKLSLYDYCDLLKKTSFQETVNMMIGIGLIERLGRNKYRVIREDRDDS